MLPLTDLQKACMLTDSGASSFVTFLVTSEFVGFIGKETSETHYAPYTLSLSKYSGRSA